MSSRAFTVDYGPEEQAMQAYFREGERRAHRLNNRGPIRFTSDGRLHPDILEAYWRCGFYIFEGVLSSEELADIETDFLSMMDRLPTEQGSPVDATGRPALGTGCTTQTTIWSKPLADPLGGTAMFGGRHQVKMFEPVPAPSAPKEVVVAINGSLQFSDALLRMYGHPQLLAVAAAINGDDFVPFNENVVIKEPGLGGSVSWHQDGVTHWNSPDWDEGSHGFNFMAQLYGCTPANGLWVIPGSHKLGKMDIKAMAAATGTDRLAEAVPHVCKPGDVGINNRQLIHGSFANTSPDWRVSFNFGFHRRKSVRSAKHGNVNTPSEFYTADYIRQRARILGYAIDARRQRFPRETPFRYRPHADAGESFCWDAKAKEEIKDYNKRDLFI
jgi:hypothetical protein